MMRQVLGLCDARRFSFPRGARGRWREAPDGGLLPPRRPPPPPFGRRPPLAFRRLVLKKVHWTFLTASPSHLAPARGRDEQRVKPVGERDAFELDGGVSHDAAGAGALRCASILLPPRSAGKVARSAGWGAASTSPTPTPALRAPAAACASALGAQKRPLDLFDGFAVAPRPRKGEG